MHAGGWPRTCGPRRVDVLLHPVVTEEQHLDPGELTALQELGQTSIKVFATLGAFQTRRRQYYRFMAEAGSLGSSPWSTARTTS